MQSASSVSTLIRRHYHKALCRKSIPSRIADAEYMVRGKLPLYGDKIPYEVINDQIKYDFDLDTTLHSGNLLELEKSPISFNREVLSVMINPALI